MVPTILLVADEIKSFSAQAVRQNRIRLMKKMFEEGWHVMFASSKEQFYKKLTGGQMISAIVLDGTNQKSGEDYSNIELKTLRKATDAPILIITDQSDERSELEILNNGMDGYLHQPVSDSIILAYVKNLLKRTGTLLPKEISYGSLQISHAEHTVKVDGVPISLTPKEFNLLYYLAQNPNLALTRYQILKNAWGIDYTGSERTVDSHIKSLRNKLGEIGDQILTIRSVGYKFLCERPKGTEKLV